MKVFNSKNAAEEYMSMHSLAYSTPDTILKKFAAWLGEYVEIECKLDPEKCPNEDGKHPRHKIPRVMLFIEERDKPYTLENEEVFKPSGVIASYFNINFDTTRTVKYCSECGNELSLDAKFCSNCGKEQETL